MTRKEVIQGLKKYFSIKELVCLDVYKTFGELAWQFFDKDYLETLLIVRVKANRKIRVNYADKHERGLRCNLCDLVKSKTEKGQLYMSSHCNGAGGDMDFEGWTAEEGRQFIISIADELPVSIRLEADVTWVHMDVYDNGSGKKVSLFKG